jgi:hypothetical protein
VSVQFARKAEGGFGLMLKAFTVKNSAKQVLPFCVWD